MNAECDTSKILVILAKIPVKILVNILANMPV